MNKKLTIDENIKYEQLKETDSYDLFSSVLFPFKIILYIALLVIALKYAYNIDIKIFGLIATLYISRIYHLYFIILIFVIIAVYLFNYINNKILIKKIIEERRKRK